MPAEENIGLMHSESAKILQMINGSPDEMKAAEAGNQEMTMNLLQPFSMVPQQMPACFGGSENFLLLRGLDHKTGFGDLPHSLSQQKIFMLFNSRELFNLRQVSTEWSDLIKTIWCQVVKDEMLQQVQNLDLLYEKETTTKLLEFKLKYLVSYAQLMRNYF